LEKAMKRQLLEKSIISLMAMTLVCSAAPEIGKPLSGHNCFTWGTFDKDVAKWNFSGSVSISPNAGQKKMPALHFKEDNYKEHDAKATSPNVTDLKPNNWYEFSYFIRIKRMDYSTRFSFKINLGKGKSVTSGSNDQLQPADGGKKWIFICKQFKMPAVCNSAQVEFSLINGGGEVWISDCRLVKLSGKRKRINENIVNPRAAFQRGQKPRSASCLTFDYGKNNTLRFNLNGKSVTPLLHKFNNHPLTYGSFNEFQGSGIKVHIIPEGYSPRSFWVAKDKYDFSNIDKRIAEALRIYPDMKIMLSVGLYPYATFGNDYPNECWRDANGERCIRNFKTGKKLWRGDKLKQGDYFCFAFASKAWRQGGAKALKALLKHINSSSYKNSIVGLHLSPAQDGQFFPWTSCRNYGVNGIGAMDFSNSQLQYFREYLRKKYNNDLATLRKVWNQPKVTFENAPFPSIKQLNKSSMFKDYSAQVVDCREAMFDVIAQVYNEFGKAVKESAGKPFFISAYYPDCTMGSANAHYATQKLLEENYIDALASPAHYGPDRITGSCGGYENIVSSYPLHNKVYLCEWDHRTWRSPIFRDHVYYLGYSENENEFANMLRREAGMALAFNYGAWFYEMDPGWYSDPKLKKEIKNITTLMSAGRQSPGLPDFEPDVAVFIDEKMMGLLSERAASIFNISTRHVIKALNLSGVPYKIYLQSDLTNPKLPDFKLYMFLNPAVFNKAQKKFIQNNLKKNNKTIVWCYAAGCGKSKTPAKDISLMTEINITNKNLSRHSSRAITVHSKNPLVKDLKYYLQVPYYPSIPIFSVNDKSALALARHSYDKSICTAVKRFKNWTSIYAAIPGSFTPQFINNLARSATAFVCVPAGDAVYLSKGALIIHGCSGKNPKQIKLPQKCSVKDPFNGKVYSTGTDTLTIDVPARQTKCFLLKKIQ
jgi:hypothetical protein